jgi:hypothetical protein
MSCNNVNQGSGQLVTFGGANLDAFGRLRVSEPFTLFDSQNRYAEDDQFSSSTVNGASITFASNESSVNMSVDTTSGSKAIRQTFRRMPYQPGKSMLILTTFCMNVAKASLRQRVGYFDDNNGIFLEQNGTSAPAITIRTNTSGTPSDTNTVSQSSWNGDKLDGTGPSGITLNLARVQIFWSDIEWLGVGNVRCGFVINGQFIICHTFQCANFSVSNTKVYMETAILPVRYEIEHTAGTGTGSTLKQICSTVISEGGYQQTVQDTIARRTAILGTISTTFLPLVSIRLKSTAAGAVVLLNRVNVLPTTNQSYEICIMKNSTLTGASWTSLSTNMEYDVTATAMTTSVDGIYQNDYVTSSAQGRAVLAAPTGYNFAYQLGTSLAGVSDTFTLGIRTVSGATTGDAIGSISFYDLTV